jgi:hypothetical protein
VADFLAFLSSSHNRIVGVMRIDWYDIEYVYIFETREKKKTGKINGINKLSVKLKNFMYLSHDGCLVFFVCLLFLCKDIILSRTSLF